MVDEKVDVPKTRPRNLKVTLGRLGAALVVFGSLGLWIYAFYFADPRVIDRLDDVTFPRTAEPVCADAMAYLDALPGSQDARTPADRALVIQAADARLREMLATLRKAVPETKDAPGITLWLDHWSTYVDDRSAFAATLATGQDAQFTVTAVDDVQITRSIDHFAEVNDMDSCKTPRDV